MVEVDEETYAQTPFSTLLTSPDLAATYKHIMDEGWPSIAFMTPYFRANGWKQPIDTTNNPYTFAHRTGGKEMWAHMAQFPDRQANSNRAMKARSFDGVWSIGLYPFAERLAELSSPSDDDDTPLVVDVGGGAGHTSKTIRELCAGVKGRIVLQDRAEVVEDAPKIEGVVSMPHDFFEPQPVKGMTRYICFVPSSSPYSIICAVKGEVTLRELTTPDYNRRAHILPPPHLARLGRPFLRHHPATPGRGNRRSRVVAHRYCGADSADQGRPRRERYD